MSPSHQTQKSPISHSNNSRFWLISSGNQVHIENALSNMSQRELWKFKSEFANFEQYVTQNLIILKKIMKNYNHQIYSLALKIEAKVVELTILDHYKNAKGL